MQRTPRRPPVIVVVVAALGLALFALPLVGLLARASWSSLGTDLVSTSSLTALRLSLECSIGATVLSVLLGMPLALVLARVPFWGRSVARAIVLLPLVLPPVVAGVALLEVFSRSGIAGRYLYDWFGLQLTFTTAGAILAETFVALPFFVITVEAALRSMDERLEEVAYTLGANRWAVFRRITVPAIAPSLLAGAVLAWARALGEFGATITFAGNVFGKTQTLPLAVYLALESQPRVAIALSLVLVVVSFAVILGLRERWLRRR